MREHFIRLGSDDKLALDQRVRGSVDGPDEGLWQDRPDTTKARVRLLFEQRPGPVRSSTMSARCRWCGTGCPPKTNPATAPVTMRGRADSGSLGEDRADRGVDVHVGGLGAGCDRLGDPLDEGAQVAGADLHERFAVR